MSEPVSCNAHLHQASAALKHPGHLYYKGEKVSYRGEEAVIVSVQPVLVIKSRSRVVCGDLYNHLDIRGGKSRFDENLH